VSTRSGSHISDYSFHWIRYEADLGSSHEAIENTNDCCIYQLQREDVGRWISISYRKIHEDPTVEDKHSDSDQEEENAASRAIIPFASTDSFLAQPAVEATVFEEHSPNAATAVIPSEQDEKENDDDTPQQNSTPVNITALTSSAVEGTESMTAEDLTATVSVDDSVTAITATASNTEATAIESDMQASNVTSESLPVVTPTAPHSSPSRRVRWRLGPVLAGPPRLVAMTVQLQPVMTPSDLPQNGSSDQVSPYLPMSITSHQSRGSGGRLWLEQATSAARRANPSSGGSASMPMDGGSSSQSPLLSEAGRMRRILATT